MSKIAVLGYFNELNAGDDRLSYCIRKLFEEHSVTFLSHNHTPHVSYLNSFDWVLIGGGGLAFNDNRVGIWKNMRWWLSRVKANIGVIGLGVNNPSQALREELLALVDRCQFFYVRDYQSHANLNFDIRVKVYPDISWWFPVPKPYNQQSKTANSLAINLVYCPWKAFDYSSWVKVCSPFHLNPFPLRFSTENSDVRILRQYTKLSNIPNEFTLEPLYNSDLLVGCRFHSIIFSIQILKPFVAIGYDDKVKVLLDQGGLSEFYLDTEQYSCLPDLLENLYSRYHEVVDQLDSYRNLQQSLSKQMINEIKAYF